MQYIIDISSYYSSMKILNLRSDTLAQILYYSDLTFTSNVYYIFIYINIYLGFIS